MSKSVSFDAAAAARRERKASARAERLVDAGDVDAARRVTQRATLRTLADADAALDAAALGGAVTPSVFRAVKASWRLEAAATPPGSSAPPAWVVRFDAASPLARLQRAGMLDAAQVAAAHELARLHAHAVRPPKLTASYDGVTGVSFGEACWVDVHCDAYQRLAAGLSALLPVERRTVLEVVVHETPLHTLASTGFGPIRKQVRAEAAALQTLSLGLTRLALAWSEKRA